ncbi:sigma 54-interacting transcriptional regulator [Enterococcus sp. DIV0756]|uniref:sigma 54-interacting transcriptional regulator n=1 Tax=Enterococcus sp. DIV0756 TaxID=2774636 RepID=UPI003F21FA9F
MDTVIFSGQKNFTREVTYLVENNPKYKGFIVTEAVGKKAEELGEYYHNKGAKLFIARGQNYDRLKNKYDIPVIEVRCCYEEILKAYQQAKKQSANIAIIGYGSIFRMIKTFQDTSGEHFLPLEIQSDDDLVELVKDGLSQGIDTFVGGLNTKNACEFLGAKHVMLEISPPSLIEALEEACHLLAVQAERNRNYQFIQTILNVADEAVFAFDHDRSISYINSRAKKVLKRIPLATLTDLILTDENYSSVFQSGNQIENKLIEIKTEQFVFSMIPLTSDNAIYGAVVHLTSANKIISSENTVRKQLYTKGHVAHKQFNDIIGNSNQMKQAVEWAKRIAKSENSILILGETGTGKELFAQSIHNHSARRDGPFIAINCAALSSSVLESELFGYEKGAFTGANTEGKMGIFEMAHHGTVFLDEIGEINLEVQAKLLRVLQEKEIVRVGGEKVIPVDVRIISATNKDLQRLSFEGKFRNDLFYRLAVLELKLPALSDRKEDIPLIISHYLTQHYPELTIQTKSLEHFKQFDYFGNIRQLINLIERCVVMTDYSEITYNTVVAICQQEFQATQNRAVASKMRAPQTEKELIEETLRDHFGNRKDTAQALNISTATLWRKMKKYELV